MSTLSPFVPPLFCLLPLVLISLYLFWVWLRLRVFATSGPFMHLYVCRGLGLDLFLVMQEEV